MSVFNLMEHLQVTTLILGVGLVIFVIVGLVKTSHLNLRLRVIVAIIIVWLSVQTMGQSKEEICSSNGVSPIFAFAKLFQMISRPKMALTYPNY